MAGNGCCPYGPLLLVPIFASTAAFIMTWVFTFDCRFFQATVSELDDRSLTFGLWTVQGYYNPFDDDYAYGYSPYGMCTGWNAHSTLNATQHIDGPLRFARVMSMILSFVSWILLVFLLFASCMIFSPGAMQGLAWGFGFVGFWCLLCLIALASDICQNATTCTLGRDGILCIFTGLVWIIAAVAVLCLRPIDKPDAPPRPIATAGTTGTASASAQQAQPVAIVPGTEEIQVQEMVALDGTVTVLTTKSAYNADGTVTVTETREVKSAAGAAAAAAPADKPEVNVIEAP